MYVAWNLVIYPGSMLYRIQARVKASRKVEGVMMDTRISRKLKRSSYVVPASINGMETEALSVQHQRRLQVRENKLDKENRRCKDSGEKENERPKRRSLLA